MNQKCNRTTWARWLTILFLLAAVLTLSAAYHPAEAAAKKKTLLAGQVKKFKKAGAKNWKSSKPGVASVDQSGTVTAISKGKTTISCKKSGKTYKWKVKVQEASLSQTSADVTEGKTFTLKVNGTKIGFKAGSTNPAVATVTKKKKNTFIIKGVAAGTTAISLWKRGVTLTCTVKVNAAAPVAHQLFFDGNDFKRMTDTVSTAGQQVTAVNNIGQSAPLYIHVDGGDGLENIWMDENTGSVGNAGVQLTPEAVAATTAKAAAWARAVCNSPYHGYDKSKTPNWLNRFGQAKANALGTGDYSCSSLALCAYYFAGVNVIGENLGSPLATYVPHSTLTLYSGYITYWENGEFKRTISHNQGMQNSLKICGFTDVYAQYKADPDNFVFQTGDIVLTHKKDHAQLVLTTGTASQIEVAQARYSDKNRIGGDQDGNELKVDGLYYKKYIDVVLRFTGEGVVLNTAGLASPSTAQTTTTVESETSQSETSQSETSQSETAQAATEVDPTAESETSQSETAAGETQTETSETDPTVGETTPDS